MMFVVGCYVGRKEEEYRHALGMFGVSSDLAMRPIASLSGGQKSRLAFAIMAVPRFVHNCPENTSLSDLHLTQ